jgi:ribosomal protein L11 methyltransferase
MASSNTSFARLRVRAADPDLAERAGAEAFAAGAQGLEEREDGCGIELLIYAESDAIGAVRAALASVGVEAAEPEAVADQNWGEAWKQHLEAIEVSDRLVVRPSFVTFDLGPDQAEVVIDPGQAFGTGSHESTRLALEWVSLLAPGLMQDARVLDVGVGTGVLALASLRLCAAGALGFDLDPLAPEAALANARNNDLGARLHCFTGGIEAIDPSARFELVLANLLRREVEPILPAIAARTAGNGAVVLSGLLESEHGEVGARAREAGLREVGNRRCTDASGVVWIGLHLEPARAAASRFTRPRAGPGRPGTSG